MVNPNFDLPGVASIFEIQARDILHIALWDIREAVKELVRVKKHLSRTDMDTLQQRMAEQGRRLPSRYSMAKLIHAKKWKVSFIVFYFLFQRGCFGFIS